jgi:hypothetical protein
MKRGRVGLILIAIFEKSIDFDTSKSGYADETHIFLSFQGEENVEARKGVQNQT